MRILAAPRAGLQEVCPKWNGRTKSKRTAVRDGRDNVALSRFQWRHAPVPRLRVGGAASFDNLQELDLSYNHSLAMAEQDEILANAFESNFPLVGCQVLEQVSLWRRVRHTKMSSIEFKPVENRHLA